MTLLLTLLALPVATAGESGGQFIGLEDRQDLEGLLDLFAAWDSDLPEVAVGDDGTWVITWNGGHMSSTNLAAGVENALDQAEAQGRTIEAVGLSDDDTWAVITDQGISQGADVPYDAFLTNMVTSIHSSGDAVRDLSLWQTGWVIADPDTYVSLPWNSGMGKEHIPVVPDPIILGVQHLAGQRRGLLDVEVDASGHAGGGVAPHRGDAAVVREPQLAGGGPRERQHVGTWTTKGTSSGPLFCPMHPYRQNAGETSDC